MIQLERSCHLSVRKSSIFRKSQLRLYWNATINNLNCVMFMFNSYKSRQGAYYIYLSNILIFVFNLLSSAHYLLGARIKKNIKINSNYLRHEVASHPFCVAQNSNKGLKNLNRHTTRLDGGICIEMAQRVSSPN